jgi:hypothetical protein
VTRSGLPESVEQQVGDIEARLRYLMAATHGPGPEMTLQHDVLATARQFREVRARLTDYYLPRDLQ